MVCSTKFLEVQKTDTQWCRSELFLREFCIACTSLQRLRRAHPPSPILNTFYVHICLLGSLQCHKLEICREGGDSREDQCVFTFPPSRTFCRNAIWPEQTKSYRNPLIPNMVCSLSWHLGRGSAAFIPEQQDSAACTFPAVFRARQVFLL